MPLNIHLRCAAQRPSEAPRRPISVGRRGMQAGRLPGQPSQVESQTVQLSTTSEQQQQQQPTVQPTSAAREPECQTTVPFQAASLSTGFPVPTGYTTSGSIYNYWRRGWQRRPGLGMPVGAAPDVSQAAAAAAAPSAAADAPATGSGPAAASGSDDDSSSSGSADGGSYGSDAGSGVPDQLSGYLRGLEARPPPPAAQPAAAAAEPSAAGDGNPAAAPGPAAERAAVRPVFRASPYAAELARQRQRQHRDTVRVLFLDEGNTCRSVLAVAVMQYMLQRLRRPMDVVVESASIGWAAPGPHDPRVARVAREMALPLPPRSAREFDELEDIVQYDLVLVMDAFDLQEVMKEVAVVERINPQGLYSTRVRRLGSFGAASLRTIPGQLADDVPDPLYGAASGAAEAAALRATVHRIAFACRGLVHSLAQLRARSPEGMSLRCALAVSLQCPLLCPGVMQGRERLSERWRPVWQQGGDLYTIRWSGQQRHVVKRASSGKARGYWQDPDNVEAELRQWMAREGATDRLPTQQQLRESGANTLAASIGSLGGLGVFSRRMGLPLSARHPNGYWDSFANLAAELAPFLRQPEAGSEARGAAAAQAPPAQRQVQQQAVQRQQPAEQPVTLGMRELRRRPPGGSKLRPPAQLSQMQDQAQLLQRAAAVAASDALAPPARRLVFPKQQQLIAAGRSDLVYAIRMHGGRAAVARQLGATLEHAPLRSAEEVCDQLLRFMRGQAAQQGSGGGGKARQQQHEQQGQQRATPWTRAGALMPTKTELYKAGRADLASAIKRLGGFHYFAGLLGLKEPDAPPAVPAAASPSAAATFDSSGSSSESDGEAVAAAGSEEAIHGPSSQDSAPVDRQQASSGAAPAVTVGPVQTFALRRAQAAAAATATSAAAPSAGAQLAPPAPRIQLSAGAAGTAATAGPSPAAPQPERLGTARIAASSAANPGTVEPGAAGGPYPSSPWPRPGSAAAALGARCPPPPMLLNVGAAMLAYMQSEGLAGAQTLPSRQALIAAGRADLANAVQRCGGGRRLAEHLGLEFEERRGRKPKHARQVSSRLPPRPDSALDDFVLI